MSLRNCFEWLPLLFRTVVLFFENRIFGAVLRRAYSFDCPLLELYGFVSLNCRSEQARGLRALRTLQVIEERNLLLLVAVRARSELCQSSNRYCERKVESGAFGYTVRAGSSKRLLASQGGIQRSALVLQNLRATNSVVLRTSDLAIVWILILLTLLLCDGLSLATDSLAL